MQYEELYNSIRLFIQPPEDEYKELESFFIYKKISKGEFIYRSGEYCRLGVFVLSGCMSYFLEDESGEEKVIDLASRGRWLADTRSLFNNTISPYSIKALADSELLLLDKETFLQLITQYPFFLYYHYFAVLEYKNIVDQLLTKALHTSAEERYLNLMQERPEVLQLAPLHDIASFLGLTPQSLSRLRHQLALNRK